VHPDDRIGGNEQAAASVGLEKRLLECEQRYCSLFELNIDPVFSLDTDGRILSMNEAANRLTGYAPEELAGLSFVPFIAPDQRERTLALFRSAAEGRSMQYETSLIDKTGNRSELHVTLTPIFVDGGVKEVLAVCKDITMKKRSDLLLDAQNVILEMIAKDLPVKDVLHHLTQTIERLADGAICSILVANEEADRLFHAAGRSLPDEYVRAINNIPVGPSVGSCGTAAYTKKQVIVADIERDPRWADYRDVALGCGLQSCWSTPIFGSGGDLLGTFAMYYREKRTPTENDLDLIARATHLASLAIQQSKRKEKIEYMAFHDPLTDLPNLRLFQVRFHRALEQAARTAESVSVLFVDMDRFKQVNDSLGHSAGDLLLQKIAERLTSCLGGKEFLCRQGGDEFIVMLEGTTMEQTEATAQALVDSLSEPYVLEGQEFVVTTSIGISVFPTHGRDAKTLIGRADKAMYLAKRKGKNNYQLYNEALDAHPDDGLEAETMMRKALEREEFVLHYQPQVEVDESRVAAVEALIRWNHPKLGLVPPAQFIPLAEESGLIVPIGEWVVRTACKQIKAWERQGLPSLGVSVNVSARQLFRPDFASAIARILEETDIDPSSLKLEITESMTMQTDAVVSILNELKTFGVQLAIDDFGTGYSSLSYLKRLPCDCLKIDRSFVSDIGKDPEDSDIVAAMVAMGRILKKTIVAEGVETEAQFRFLRQQRCDKIQGFYIGKPVEGESLPAELERIHAMLATL